ncbi:putative aryl-alcohol dehydrogenase protein [Neofusicoccum parvum]|uniref:Aryl-alcohol dehydrogenase protein n=1 Tax=Neofusicoccum parvum TaxID=310453 RepID=A0ACB5S7V5_9PEZI|nr:putative aryl-alcohol dehydrogenase protein [Neofusicoccum parvum]
MADTTNGTSGALPAVLTSAEEFVSQEYDYVIIGGGTAGLVIAARLTENPDVTVGVLEAGKNKLDDPMVDIPALFKQMLGNPEYDWMLTTAPQAGTKGLVHQMPRGKVLGGSSGINYMGYVRGSDQDYDDWAILADDAAWSAANMKKYIKKHQTLDPIDDAITNRSAMSFVPANHGTSGPIHTSFNDSRLSLEDEWILACDAAANLDGKKPIDPWGGEHIGFYNGLGSIYRVGPHRGKRSYATRSYLEPNAQRPNLKVLCEAPVTSIVIETAGEADVLATGARFTHRSATHIVRARREVILSAGAIHSPQLLELSGIGDPAVLRAAGVDVRVQLPSVGNNYQDHIATALAYELVDGEKSLDNIWDPQQMALAQHALAENQGGPLTSSLSGQGFLAYKRITDLLHEPEEYSRTLENVRKTQESPDTTPFQKRQLELVMAHLKDDESANLQYLFFPLTAGLTDDTIGDQTNLFPAADPKKPNQMATVSALQYPVSRGSVHIQSADPSKPPVIDPAYLSHPADVAVMAAGIKFADRIHKTGPIGPKATKRLRPAESVDINDTATAEETVRDFTIGEYHSCGSCAMGETVDSHLRVYGVKRLRVADASIFPNHVSGNIQSSVYAMAEHAADIIKQDQV